MNTVTLHLKPMAWKILKRDFPFDGTAVDITRSHIYPFLISCLQHRHVYTAAELRRRPVGLEEGKVYITDYDFDRYGACVRSDRQASLSKIICDHEKDIICRHVAALHVYAGVSRRAAMRHILAENDFDFADLNLEALKKHYQRHYLTLENKFWSDLQHINNSKNTQN